MPSLYAFESEIRERAAEWNERRREKVRRAIDAMFNGNQIAAVRLLRELEPEHMPRPFECPDDWRDL